MPDVTTLTISATASVDKAVSSLKKLNSALGNVESGTKKTASATKASVKTTKDSADAVGDLAKRYRSMGLSRVAKQFTAIHKAANLAKGATKSVHDAMSVADSFSRNGQTGLASSIRELGANPMASESALKTAEETEKERTAIAKQETKEQAAAFQRARKIAAEAERAYTQIVNEEARKRQAAIREAARAAAAEERQSKREQLIGARELAKARAAAAKEAARVEKQAAKEREKAAKEAEKAARKQAAEEEKAAEEEAKRSEARKKAALESIGLIGKSEAPFKRIKAFLKSIGRIAIYRAIRTAIKNISAATKEGLTNLKAYSEQVGTAFAPAVDNLRRHVLWLKNAFATALRPVIEALIPIIQQLVDWLVKAADFVAQVMSVLTGKVDDNGRYTKAVLSDLEQSNKQAKELRRTLLGFDEINRLDGDTGSGESTNAGLMFTQADVSEEAVTAASKIRDIIEKVKEFVANTDWEMVLKVVAGFLALRTLIKVFTAVKKAWDFIRGIGSAIGGIISKLGVVGSIAVAVAIAFALWGDKISEFLDKANKDVAGFFDKLKKKVEGSQALTSLIGVISDALQLVIGVVSKVASIIYKLVHGDFKGALDDGLDLLKLILKGAVKLVAGVVNVVLGLISDMANLILNAVRWVWNNALAPAINWVYTAFMKVKTWIHNAFLDLRIGILSVIKWILEKVDELLQSILGGVNKLIATMNEVLGTNIKPVEFHIETTAIDNKIAELESKKLPPITETVEVVGQWKEPAKLNLHIDTSGALAAIDRIGQKVNQLGSAVSSVIQATGAAGNRYSSVTIQKYAAGGFPAMGTMFIAGERGAEYVGDIGGRTGVMNTEQMERALYRAMVSALTVMPRDGGDIYLDGEVIYRNVVRRNNNMVRSTGRTALLT